VTIIIWYLIGQSKGRIFERDSPAVETLREATPEVAVATRRSELGLRCYKSLMTNLNAIFPIEPKSQGVRLLPLEKLLGEE